MKLRLRLALLLLCFGATSCYDDSKLWDELQDHEARIESLETLCSQLNTNISSLQSIVTALQSNDYVTAVAPIQEGDDIIGYTITFSKSGSVTIYHGKDGEDCPGQTPAIGVKQDTDGAWYWVVDGRWLTDEQGNKVKATATGKDGITPKLKIENDYWFISYDNGSTWAQLGKVSGEDGAAECIFKDFEETDNYLKLTLADDSVITLNKNKALTINFEGAGIIKCLPSTTVTIPYTITGAEGPSMIAVICQGKWEAEVEQTDNMYGNIHVHVPSNSDSDKISVIIYNSGRAYMVDLVFGLFFDIGRSGNGWDHDFSEKAHDISLHIKTNIDYTVSIPEDAQDWISCDIQQSVKSFSEEQISLHINRNDTPYAREAVIRFVDSDGVDVMEPYEIRQNQGYIKFASPQLEAVLLNSPINYNGDDRISYFEATSAYSLSDVNFQSISGEWTFNELEKFTSLRNIGEFEDCHGLKEITLPQSLERIENYAFADCSALESLHIPESVHSISSNAFNGCDKLSLTLDEKNYSFILEDGVLYDLYKTSIVIISSKYTGHFDIPSTVESYNFPCNMHHRGITSVKIPSSWTEIPHYAFEGWTALESIDIPSSVTTIGNYAFAYCSKLSEVTLPPGLETLSTCVFVCCTSLTSLTLPEGLKKIENVALADTNIENLHIPANVESIEAEAFCWSTNLTITVDVDNQHFCADKNGMYSKDMTKLIYVNPGIDKDYVVPASVTKLGYIVFKGNELKSITIHSNVESIGGISFWDCTGCDITMNMLGTTPPSMNIGPISAPESGSLKIIVPESAYETYLADGMWGSSYQYLTYNGMDTWSIYGNFDGSGSEKEIKLLRAADHFIVKDVEFSVAGRFRFILNSDTDESYGASSSDTGGASVLNAEIFGEYDLVADGADICLPAGTYDIIIAKDLSSFSILVKTWGIVGSFNYWSTPDITMFPEKDWYVAYNVTWENDTEFKFRLDEDWTQGDIGTNHSAFFIDTRYDAVPVGENINVAAGTYDIYLSKDLTGFYIMTPGKIPEEN